MFKTTNTTLNIATALQRFGDRSDDPAPPAEIAKTVAAPAAEESPKPAQADKVAQAAPKPAKARSLTRAERTGIEEQLLP
jgi:hypothetical protein